MYHFIMLSQHEHRRTINSHYLYYESSEAIELNIQYIFDFTKCILIDMNKKLCIKSFRAR
jgi:hypothetical protein